MKFLSFKNNILINPILKAEIGRVIYYSFFELRDVILEKIKDRKKKINFDDFWISLNQKIMKKRSNHLKNRCFSIITIVRNHIDQIPIDRSDPNYEIKQIHRIETALDVVINKLLDFQEEISSWINKTTFYCPRSEWKINFCEDTNCYEFLYFNSCVKKICNDRESKLEELTIKSKNVFRNILNESYDFCDKAKLPLDMRFYETIEKLIKINEGKRKFDFRIKYCFNLGDFLICELLLDSDNYIYTLNLNDFILILYFLKIEKSRIIPFY